MVVENDVKEREQEKTLLPSPPHWGALTIDVNVPGG